MLENCKSYFFLKIFFSFFKEGRKLDIIKYNKKLQNILDINIINYKLYSKRYILYEANGEGAEYNYNNKLVFKGEYKNKKRNGKGKEYYNNGIIKFEGEYLNGEKNGYGKEYDKFCFLIFEGEYLKGTKWNGKGYNKLNNNIYELENGKGYVKKYSKNNTYLLYEGEFSKGKSNGKGKVYHSNGQIKFEGEYFNGKKWNGKGYDNYNNVIYELKNGKGIVKKYKGTIDRLSFEGEYKNGKKNGICKEYYIHNGILKFEGMYENGKISGKGKEYDIYGNLNFEGEYLYNFKLKGKEFYKGKLEYEGDYLYNKKYNGKGYDENGNIIYELFNKINWINNYL